MSEPFKKVYLFDEKSGAFIVEYNAQLSPTEPELKDENGVIVQHAVYNVPICSTEIQPPPCKGNEIPVFHRELNAWAIQQDYRGAIWFQKETGEAVEITEIGDPGNDYAPDIPLKRARELKAFSLRHECSEEISGGFECEALGEKYRYPFKISDQQNLVHAATIALFPDLPDDWTVPLKCMDIKGTWARIPHNAKEVREVMHAALAHRDSLSAKMESLDRKIDAAKTLANVEKITWMEA